MVDCIDAFDASIAGSMGLEKDHVRSQLINYLAKMCAYRISNRPLA